MIVVPIQCIYSCPNFRKRIDYHIVWNENSMRQRTNGDSLLSLCWCSPLLVNMLLFPRNFRVVRWDSSHSWTNHKNLPEVCLKCSYRWLPTLCCALSSRNELENRQKNAVKYARNDAEEQIGSTSEFRVRVAGRRKHRAKSGGVDQFFYHVLHREDLSNIRKVHLEDRNSQEATGETVKTEYKDYGCSRGEEIVCKHEVLALWILKSRNPVSCCLQLSLYAATQTSESVD
jgi:hypothetical protein